ncbi:hypothetical protein HON71_01060 [Candidatus Woesearchaeota archaeon]|jgi:hypothetical protein|nr:hypothetical protein [Candidatus Woesearchaeota archaeon]MBT5342963.1 hypothetical protein [Candidatus Woesearchaeota archaeon]
MESEQKDCNCEGDDDCDIEEMVNNNSFVLDTLIELLIEKKIITEEELRKKLDANQEEEQKSEVSDE